jgi:hypothetical protein
VEKFYILTFENTHNAINGEMVLKNSNIKAVVMPTPTFISKSCGISLKLSEGEVEKVKPLISEGKIKIKGTILKEGSNFKEISLV